MSDSTTKKSPQDIVYEVGSRFDFGGGKTGPDMGFEDGLELQRQMVSPGDAVARQAIKEWAWKFQKSHDLPNTNTSQPGNPDKGTLNLWKLWRKK